MIILVQSQKKERKKKKKTHTCTYQKNTNYLSLLSLVVHVAIGSALAVLSCLSSSSISSPLSLLSSAFRDSFSLCTSTSRSTTDEKNETAMMILLVKALAGIPTSLAFCETAPPSSKKAK